VAESDLEISDFDYDLPPDRIAQEPARPRDASRLLVLDRRSGAVTHHRFSELPELLAPGDLLVLNDTRVLPAAFTACRASGSRIEGCFLRSLDGGLWEVLLAGRGRLRCGETLALIVRPGGSRRADAADAVHAEIELVGRGDGGTWHVRPPAGIEAVALLARIGRPPLPPYIRRGRPDEALAATDREDYQTVYARRDGAVAAPTAGLHFTPQVFERLQARGIERAMITLHVGLGTFQPVRAGLRPGVARLGRGGAGRLAEHRMHEEYFEIGAEAAEQVNRARAGGRRIVAVGTTTVRALETAAGLRPGVAGLRPGEAGEGGLGAMRGWTRLFIRPPYEFRITGALLTNFHLPRTTLLALVAALAGRERVLAVYEEAIRAGYRFYSYGDAMLIL